MGVIFFFFFSVEAVEPARVLFILNLSTLITYTKQSYSPVFVFFLDVRASRLEFHGNFPKETTNSQRQKQDQNREPTPTSESLANISTGNSTHDDDDTKEFMIDLMGQWDNETLV